MKPVTIGGAPHRADLTIVEVLPALPGLFVLEASELSGETGEDIPRGHQVLSWGIEADSLMHLPIAGRGIIDREFCVFNAAGTVIAQDGCEECTATVSEWIAEVQSQKRQPRAC